MKKKNGFRSIALLGLALSVLIGFTACKQKADGSNSNGSGSTPTPPADSFNRTTGEGVVGGKPFKMKSIPAANYVADKIGDDSRYNNKKRPVSLSEYMLGETEVTQELWDAVMGSDNNPSNFDGSTGKEVATGETQSKRPVEKVNWYQAIAFCNKLSLKLGLDCCYTVAGIADWENLEYSAIPTNTSSNEEKTKWNNATLYLTKNGFRLPTESEWEWAAKGGTENKYAGTDDEGQLAQYAWSNPNSDTKTHEFGKKTANGYGLYDMSGNVFEWCHDRYASITDDSYLGQDYIGAPSASGANRVIRGGCWCSSDVDCSRSYRAGFVPGNELHILGFRLACRP